MFTDEQWKTIQQFDAQGKSNPKYTNEEKLTFWFCGAIMLYLICQVARVAL